MSRILSNRLLLNTVFLLLVLIGLIALNQRSPVLTIANKGFQYEAADTVNEQQQGLSGRASLDDNRAMLFIFPTNERQCFWMRDMHFAIDMIWLNAQKEVVYIKENALPESYPDSYCPDHPSRYVVEVKAGTVRQTGLKLSDTVRF